MDPEATSTVLVVDDDEQLLDLYRLYLEDRYHVRTAATGDDALDRFDDAVDLVLLDRRMPGTNGDEVLDALRERGFEGPVTMVTAVDPDTDIVDMPFDDYLVKPVTRDELTDLVETLLRRVAYDRDIREYFAVVSKVAVLEAELSPSELAANAEYQDLAGRLDRRREETRTTVAGMSPDEMDMLFRDIDAPSVRDLDAGGRPARD